jgi:hypothetical protein
MLGGAALAVIAVPAALHAQATSFFPPLRVSLRVDPALQRSPVTGRMFVIVTRDSTPEPRLQAGGLTGSVPFYGVDVSQLPAGQSVMIDGRTLGYPVKSLDEIPPGDYWVQGVLNVYTKFARADGHTIWAHMDQWEGQHFNTSPGNFVSVARKVHLDPKAGGTIHITLTSKLPPIEMPADTRWVKHVRIQSPMLTKWWGHPMFLGATVLLPKGYDEHPDQRYPTVYDHGHFSLDAPFGFTDDSSTDTRERRAALKSATEGRETGYQFYTSWTSDSFPRVIAATLQHPTPYYDDSYAVNSANNGPYGDAILGELIPYLEQHFRMIPEPWARLNTGGSTGGWIALAMQVYHPDFFGGTWSFYPDPVDFRRYQLGNVYADTNAFVIQNGPWHTAEIPAERRADGQPSLSVREESQLEAVLGSKGRSGEQFDIWEAAYGPVGADGYPAELWDDLTGHIHRDVAEYMRAHDFDIRDYLERNWKEVGPKLAGQMHIYVGDMDNYYLNLAVYHLQDFLELATPTYGGEIRYGRPLRGHGWQPMSTADLIRMMAKHAEERHGKQRTQP